MNYNIEICFHQGRKEFMAEIETRFNFKSILFSKDLNSLIGSLNKKLQDNSPKAYAVLLTPKQHDDLLSEAYKYVNKNVEILDFYESNK